MTEQNNAASAVPAAKSSSSKLTLLVAWIVPIVAVAVAAWLVIRAVPETSASVTLNTPNAEGLSATNTLVKYRGVPIGKVSGVELSEDLEKAILTLELDEGYGTFATEGARYWIVRPRFENANFDSLRTIISGPYVSVLPGSGAAKTEFDALNQPPVDGQDEIAFHITLTSPAPESIRRNTAVSWRGEKIGLVVDKTLHQSGRHVEISIGIFEDAKHLVRTNSVFWNAGGLDVSFGLFSGAEVRADSMQALLQGDIAVATPDEAGNYLTGDEQFPLHAKSEDDWLKWHPDLSLEPTLNQEKSKTKEKTKGQKRDQG